MSQRLSSPTTGDVSVPVFTPSLPRRAAVASALAALTAVPAVANAAPLAAVPPAAIVTPPAEAVASTVPPGSIAALGRTISMLRTEQDRLDVASLRARGTDEGDWLIERRDEVHEQASDLGVFAMRQRARTLADAAVQAALIEELLGGVTASSLMDQASPWARERLEGCRLGAASLTLLLADIAGVPMTDLGEIDKAQALNWAFPGSVTVEA